MQRESTQWLIPALLAIIAAVALWYFWTQMERRSEERPTVELPARSQPATIEPLEGPRHPLPAVERTGNAKLTPLPALDESDEYFRIELADLYGDAVVDVLVESGLVEKLVATVDNLPRPHIAERIRPVGALSGQFQAEGNEGSEEYALSPDNYRRYDVLVGLIAGADIDEVVDTYRRYYPLFQSAYVELGYPDGYFNDRLVEVIDHLLETPAAGSRLRLTRPHVLYEYADPELEDLSSGQKLLLRMGDAHAATIKQTLRDLRSSIVGT